MKAPLLNRKLIGNFGNAGECLNMSANQSSKDSTACDRYNPQYDSGQGWGGRMTSGDTERKGREEERELRGS